MNPVTVDEFPAYFQALHGREPYDWQCRLVRQVIKLAWPKAIDLPTGSGKTSCLDIAVFALACQASLPNEERTAPRRIFFCVNRRVIVDEAHQRAVRIARLLANAEDSSSILGRVAASLRTLSTMNKVSAPPLDVLELRGGIYRDNRWARSVTQPTIVCTTIDQLGSRLLFRGYGVTTNADPIHAALIAYDSLVLLDEAHISRPFLQTLNYVELYLDPEKWAEKSIGIRPMIVVPMTATPPAGLSDADVIRLEDTDRRNAGLNNRLSASKIAKLITVPDVAEAAVTEVNTLAKDMPTAVGIIVNRVATAKAIYEQLREANKDKADVVVELVIGSMRPIDRDMQAKKLRELVGPDRPQVTSQSSFTVATQCLEVGADYDFDALVTECASLDALRQRFGRLNRGGRTVEAKAVILAEDKGIKPEGQLDDKEPIDPIYGNALARTWNWLSEYSHLVRQEAVTTTNPKSGKPKEKAIVCEHREIDFGIDAFSKVIQQHGDNGQIPADLLAPSASKDAPVMLPAYIDFWCQTSPRPTPDPDVSLFIHGLKAGEPDVQVCWRADLDYHGFEKSEQWCDVVSLLPPTSAECMAVPISRVRKWLSREVASVDGDLLGTEVQKERDESKRARKKELDPNRRGVLWRRSKDSAVIKSPDDLRPGDTLVLPVTVGGWNELGHIPPVAAVTAVDQAERAFRESRNRGAIRLHPIFKSQLPQTAALDDLFGRLDSSEDPLTVRELRQLLTGILADLPDFGKRKIWFDYYPDDRGVVVTTRERLGCDFTWVGSVTDDGDDDQSRTTREEPITLKDHTKHVRDETLRTVGALPLTELATTYLQAADWHDLGKADERFQAMLRRSDRTDAWLLAGFEEALLAKSDGLPLTPLQRKLARERAGLPEHFRHELLSVQIVEMSAMRETAGESIDILLHLIGSHHGYARPFAPVVVDNEYPEVAIESASITTEQRTTCPPHRIDSGIAERFWALTRTYGWWGLAFLEAVLRLADQQASADEEGGLFDDATTTSVIEDERP